MAVLKGVNKHVVEVVDIDHQYFERAILFIKAEQPAPDEASLRAGAREYIGSISYVPRRPFSMRALALAAGKLGAAAALGAAVAGLLLR